MFDKNFRDLVVYPDRGFGCIGEQYPSEECRAPARIVVIHDDPVFSNELAARLKPLGHEVRCFDDITIVVRAPCPSDVLEIAIVRPTNAKGGLRIKAVGIPHDGSYAGPLMKFLVEPITVSKVIELSGCVS